MRRRPPSDHSFTLPRRTLARLLIICGEAGDKPLDVVIDAVDLHLDELEACKRHWAAEQGAGPLGPRTARGSAPPPDDQVAAAAADGARRAPQRGRQGERGQAISGESRTRPAPQAGPLPAASDSDVEELPAFLRRPTFPGRS